MKKLLFSAFAIAMLIAVSSCSKTEYGEVTFWQFSGSGYGVTTVTLDGGSSSITSEYNGTPACGASGCAIFTSVETGSYSYTASDGFDSWSGTVNISADQCLTVELY
ncbi:MAG: hypothetical protein QNK23_11875 [Crocinitomicaceae bacterium]|nr:hypothetical protein [Crocinitomicaceae bacterium]